MKKLMKLFPSFTLLFLLGCNDPSESPINTNEETYVIHREVDTVITTGAGIKIYFPKSSFEGPDSTDIKFEMLNKADALIRKVSTITKDRDILISSGMFKLEFEDSLLDLVRPIIVKIPTDSLIPNMLYFEGINEQNSILWQQPMIVPNTCVGEVRQSDDNDINSDYTTICPELVIPVEDLSDDELSYVIELNHLGWVNLDIFYEYPSSEMTDLKVVVFNGGKFQDVFVSLIFKDIWVNVPAEKGSDEAFYFSGEISKPSLPKDKTAYLYAKGSIQGETYYALKEIVTGQHDQDTLYLKKTTDKELYNLLENTL